MKASPTLVLVLALAAGTALAGPDPDPLPRLGRGDILDSFLRFERAYRDHPPVGERLAAVNRAFGRATRAFFRGGIGQVVKTLDATAATLRPRDEDTPARRLAESLRVIVEPPVVVAGAETGPAFRVYSVYDADLTAGAKPELAVRVRFAGATVPLARVSAGPVDVSGAIPAAAWKSEPGIRTVEMVLPDGSSVVAGRWFVVATPLASVRAANETRLGEVKGDTPALADALRIARDRNSLLRDRPDRNRSIDMLTDPVALSRALTAEIEALEKGRDPYARRPGHLWRTITVGRRRVPVRLHAPRAVTSGEPLPLVVALHGAGADENVFPEAYGAGRIVRLAEERGFIMASPLTTGFMGNSRCLPALLGAIEPHWSVDRSRVYVIGHSLGGMAATLFAQSEADRLAGVVALAGGGRVRTDRAMAPTLFLAGEIDPIVPASRVRSAYESAKAAGFPVEFRVAKNYGHTLLVGDHLPEAIAWLFERRRTPAKTEEPR